ncbi:slit homolog 1 protein-like [Liolophura sinensis]|uniref:slit homolog 1 protein-like n=1 Tax=Liolophura sinensis TaxID=3198878 RepID=UPI0031590713
MALLSWTLLLACALFHGATSETVDGCSYTTHPDGIAVACKGLSKFPSHFPNQTYIIGICSLQTDEIPSYAFRGLRNLKSIEIMNSRIGAIRKFAFYDFDGVEIIKIANSSIKAIDTFAFSRMNGITKLAMHNSSVGQFQRDAFNEISDLHEISFSHMTISCIKAGAFSYIRKVAVWSFRDNYIGTIETDAFFESTFAFFHLYRNRFENIMCGSLDVAVKIAMNEASVIGNTICCGCNILWMLQPDRGFKMNQLLEGLSCVNANTMSNKEPLPLSSLSWEDPPCKDDEERRHYNTSYCPHLPRVEIVQLGAIRGSASQHFRTFHPANLVVLGLLILMSNHLLSQTDL